MNNREIIADFLEDLRVDLIAEYNRRDFRASGKFENGLEIEVADNRGVLWSEPHVEQMNRGRGPTQSTAAGNPTVYEQIRKWIDDKGLSPSDGISRDSLAFLIARKIHREGYSVQGREGMVEDVISEDRIDKLIEAVRANTLDALRAEIRGEFEKIAAA